MTSAVDKTLRVYTAFSNGAHCLGIVLTLYNMTNEEGQLSGAFEQVVYTQRVLCTRWDFAINSQSPGPVFDQN